MNLKLGEFNKIKQTIKKDHYLFSSLTEILNYIRGILKFLELEKHLLLSLIFFQINLGRSDT